jgi:diguanylate cyclase
MSNGRLIADRIRQAVAGIDLETRISQPVGIVTLSGGVAELCPGESADDLIGRADEALCRAKQGGRNRIESALTPPAPRP